MAEDLQVKLEEHRRRKHEAERLKEQTLQALEAGHGGKARLKPFAHFTKIASVRGHRQLLELQGNFHSIAARARVEQKRTCPENLRSDGRDEEWQDVRRSRKG